MTEFQVWMAAGGRGHLLSSLWEELMLRSQFQRPLSNPSFQPDAKACKGQLWKQAVGLSCPTLSWPAEGKRWRLQHGIRWLRSNSNIQLHFENLFTHLKIFKLSIRLNSILVPLLTNYYDETPELPKHLHLSSRPLNYFSPQ